MDTKDLEQMLDSLGMKVGRTKVAPERRDLCMNISLKIGDLISDLVDAKTITMDEAVDICEALLGATTAARDLLSK